MIYLLNLFFSVELIRPGVLSSFVFENKPSFLFSHNENITEGIAVAVELILNLLGLCGVEYLPGVRLCWLQGIAEISQHRDELL